jgi:hypothetical protein
MAKKLRYAIRTFPFLSQADAFFQLQDVVLRVLMAIKSFGRSMIGNQ